MNKFLLLLAGLGLHQIVAAQASACPDVFTSDTSICGTAGCVNLNATVQGTAGTDTYNISQIPYSPYAFTGGNQVLVNVDDTWSSVIPLPFCFEFFGVTYNNILIGSNAIITFDITQVNPLFCEWAINNGNPSNLNPTNSIMAPWHDIDPSVGITADINWQVYGTAPCRQFVINWTDVPMFSPCNNMLATSQLVLHESTNIIDVYLKDKPVCTGWNGGAAILGIQDSTGAVGYTVPGYNFPTQWTATNEGWRFMPSGTPNYIFGWYDMSGNLLSNSTSYLVCPTATTSYVAVVTNTSCAGTIVVADTATVSISGGSLTTQTTSTPETCGNGNGTATTNPQGTGPFTYLWSPGGQTTQTATGLSAGTYIVIIIDGGGCGAADTVVVQNTSPPIDPVISTNAPGGQVSQIGPGAPVELCFTTTSPATITGWQWVFNGTQNSTAQSACFTVTDTGTYCAALSVIDANGCADTATVCVLVTSEAIFTFPNVFTPNNDGSNDLFLATTVGVKDLKVYIYDRWGAQIYEWEAADANVNTTGWNGKSTGGKEAADGVYYWVAVVNDYQLQAQEVSGFVQLIRGMN